MEEKKDFSQKSSLWMSAGIALLLVVVIIWGFQVFRPAEPEYVQEPEPVYHEETFFPYTFEQEGVAVREELPAPAEVTAPAPIEVAAPVPTPVPAPAGSAPSVVTGKFVIQVASFQDKKKADAAAEALGKQGHIAAIETKDLGAKGVWHRVYVDGFATKEEAQGRLNDVKKDYPDAFVKQL